MERTWGYTYKWISRTSWLTPLISTGISSTSIRNHFSSAHQNHDTSGLYSTTNVVLAMVSTRQLLVTWNSQPRRVVCIQYVQVVGGANCNRNPQSLVNSGITINHQPKCETITGWWLTSPSAKNMTSSVGMMTFQSEWKNKTCLKPPTRSLLS